MGQCFLDQTLPHLRAARGTGAILLEFVDDAGLPSMDLCSFSRFAQSTEIRPTKSQNCTSAIKTCKTGEKKVALGRRERKRPSRLWWPEGS